MAGIQANEKLKPIRIRYGAESAQFGDLYLPTRQKADNGLHPVMLLIHGGYWKDNHDLNSYATAALIPEMIAAGWAVWNIEYRRMDSCGANIKAPWPSVFVDVAAAADALRRFADEHALDINDVSVIGHSAGGCLALWVANRGQIPTDSQLYQPNPLRIRRALSIGGVLSLTHPEDLCQPEQISRLMGGSATEWPERYRACDPSQLYDLAVRTLVIHGEQDETVSVRQALYYARQAPGHIALELWPDASHFSMLPHAGEWKIEHWQALNSQIRQFFGIPNAEQPD